MSSNTYYQSIPHSTMQEEDLSQENHRLGWRASRLVVVVMGALALFGATAHISYRQGSMSTASLIHTARLGNPVVKACTFDECYASNCNQEVAPFTCLFNNGGPHGGCSPTPWTQESCDESCTLSGCKDLPIPKSVKGCTDPCPKDWCAGGQVCPSDVPYQCMVGSARYGCSTDSLTWTLHTDGSTCSSCCNAAAC
jgi:hypothetical protein